jgi:hypothetical protein
MKNVQLSAEGDEAADDVSSSSPPLNATAAGLTDESLLPNVSIADGDRPSVQSGGRTVFQKEMQPAAETKEGVFAKKTAKTQGSAETAEIMQKVVGTDLSATSKAAMATLMEGAIPVVQATATGVVPRSDVGTTADEDVSEAVSGMAKASPGVAPATVDVSGRKNIERGTKAMDAGAEVPFTDDQLLSPKSDVGLEKMTAVAMPVSDDGDNKIQNVPGLAFGQAHVMAGGVGVALSIAPGAVVSGNTTGDLSVTKLPATDAGMHASSLPVGSREQDGPGIAAASMDGMPQMLTARPTALEVGIQNGTHGWLKVRAEMADGGVVNASVSAVSSAGQEMLHRELPALTAYLQEEKVVVNAIIVHGPLPAGAESRSSTGMDGAGGQTPQRSNEEAEQQQNVRKAISHGSDEAMTYQSLHGVDEDGSLSLVTYAGGGSWLSVRA